jgi:cell division protein FtsI/penicillin-binding protein 2
VSGASVDAGGDAADTGRADQVGKPGANVKLTVDRELDLLSIGNE